MTEKHFPVPTVQPGMSEADLNQFCRGYLQGLVDNNLVVSLFLINVQMTCKGNIKTPTILENKITDASILIGAQLIKLCLNYAYYKVKSRKDQ